jgi:hypothetical protein
MRGESDEIIMGSPHSGSYDLWMGILSLLLGGVFCLFQAGFISFGVKDQAALQRLRTGLARWIGPGLILSGCAYLISIWL